MFPPKGYMFINLQYNNCLKLYILECYDNGLRMQLKEEFSVIQNKMDLKRYLTADKTQLGITRRFPRPFTDEIWKYEINLRKYEFWLNKQSAFSKVIVPFYKLKHHRLGIKLGIEISPNVVEQGLSIAHGGCIEINDHARVGRNLRIQ